MSASLGKEVIGEIRDDFQKIEKERIDDKVSRIQDMDITRAAAALLEANVDEGTIERLLCKYWDLRPSEAHRFIREGEEERKI